MSKITPKRKSARPVKTKKAESVKLQSEEVSGSIELLNSKAIADPVENNFERESVEDSLSLFSPELAEVFSPSYRGSSESERIPLIPLNCVALVGRVGAAPEITYFESGTVATRFSLAVRRPIRDDIADWFNIELWGKDAEFAANYVSKGRLVGVQGYLKIESWYDSNYRIYRSKPIIKANRLELLDKKPAGVGE